VYIPGLASHLTPLREAEAIVANRLGRIIYWNLTDFLEEW
jgi:hypothetical protein